MIHQVVLDVLSEIDLPIDEFVLIVAEKAGLTNIGILKSELNDVV